MWKCGIAGGGGNKKILILYWSIRTRNSLSPSSSRSFRTQPHWSFITGQCTNSEQFLRVHLSNRMCNQFTFRHKFWIDIGRTKLEHVCGSYEQRTQRYEQNWPGSTMSCRVQAEKVEETSKHGDWVDIKLAQQKGFKLYQTRSNAIIFCDTLPAYCIPKAIMMETGEIIYEKVYASPRPPPKISLKHD